MKLDELKHVLRASAAIANENSMVVVGSQAILLLLEQPPESILVSREVDLYPALHPERADLIDGAIGMHSSFHETFGYFADGVGPETAVMPADWMTRASLHYIGDITAICPELHDLSGVEVRSRPREGCRFRSRTAQTGTHFPRDAQRTYCDARCIEIPCDPHPALGRASSG